MDVDERHELAAAISSNASAHQIDRHNKKVRTLPLGEAVAADVPFYVDVDPAVVAADFDQADATAVADRIWRSLRIEGFRPVLLASGREGHRHLLVRVDDPQQRERIEARILDAVGGDRRVLRRTIRPPGAAHRDAPTRSEIIAPESAEAALLHLSAGEARHPVPATLLTRMDAEGLRDPGNGIAPEALALADRSAEVFALQIALRRLDFTAEEAWLLLSHPASQIGRRIQERIKQKGADGGHPWFMRSWSKVDAAVAKERRRALLDLLDRAWAWSMKPESFGPQHPASSRKVYQALLQLARRSRRQSVVASYRVLKEEAQIASMETVTRALRSLEERGLIKPDRTVRYGSRQRQARAYYLTLDDADLPDEGAALPDPELVNHPCFRERSGLGQRAGRIFEHLLWNPGGRTPRAIADALHMDVRTVRKHLDRMRTLAMVVEGEAGWEVGDYDLAAAAESLGAMDAARRDVRTHDIQRELYDRVLDLRAAAHGTVQTP